MIPVHDDGRSKARRNYLVQALAGACIGFLAVRLTGLMPGRKGPSLFDGNAWYGLDPAMKPYLPFVAMAICAWVAFSFYWEAVSKKAAQSKSQETSRSRAMHVIPVSIAQLLVLAPIRGWGRWTGAAMWWCVVGLAILLAGISIAVWARRNLGRNWSGAIAIKVEHQLVRSGPYRFLRHPIYTGLLGMYVGSAVLNGEWLAVAGVVVVFLSYWRKIRLEESALSEAFGPEYAAYRKRTWALVPGVI